MLQFQLEKPLPDDQLQKYFAVLDTDFDGKVSLAEYIKSIGWITASKDDLQADCLGGCHGANAMLHKHGHHKKCPQYYRKK